ncbi:EamA-like transporter family protein [Thalassovita litoralis]|jgi:multidrug transporter EmrE-like cation transporter|uniref:EamA-like transporter family protein n=1 Tax=Thalassovita litoralis TaxID=1010611 RepID=A0A521FRX7_9RHOB|nr:EamA family transporter [Thalassovita litoralis]SMO98241.1 EamA-like transporter family protein [Thalassovita litoralis]
MTFASFALVFISVAISAVAQTAFKLGVSRVAPDAGAGLLGKALAMLFSPWVLGGLALYGVGTVLWLFALKRLDLSLAYPFVAMSFVMVAMSGMLVLGEPVNAARVLGIGLIVAGLVVMAWAG